MAVLLCLSAFFSGGETALFSLSRAQLQRLRASRSPFHQMAAYLAAHPRELLMTVLLGNMTVNVGFFALSATLTASIGKYYGPIWAVASGVAALLAVILFGEVTPKNIAATAPAVFAPIVSAPLWGLQWVVRPIRWLLATVMITPLTRLITGRRYRAEPYATTRELQGVVKLATGQGAVSPDEGKMLNEVLQLAGTRVKNVMVPRVKIVGCDVSAPTREAVEIFRRTRLTKIPLWRDSVDEIVGLVYAKDAFLNPSRPLAPLVRNVHFVPEAKTVESLLRDFQQRKIQLAIVVDEYGGTAGLVTLEDCLEKIVGEIREEPPREENT